MTNGSLMRPPLMPDPMPMHRCGILTVAELEACLRVLRLAAQSPARVVLESEITCGTGSQPDDHRAAGALIRCGHIATYGAGDRRVHATERGLLYLAQISQAQSNRPNQEC